MVGSHLLAEGLTPELMVRLGHDGRNKCALVEQMSVETRTLPATSQPSQASPESPQFECW
jgi:hypothetical protein